LSAAANLRIGADPRPAASNGSPVVALPAGGAQNRHGNERGRGHGQNPASAR
jgi:hypothetical protein